MKIAFCFLVYDTIVRNDVWNTFFDQIDPHQYKVIIHPKFKKEIPVDYYQFPYSIVKNPIHTTAKDNITIVKATLQLLKEAYDDTITHYLFLSQSCIPLYPFHIIYPFLECVRYSIVSSIPNNKKERYHSLSNTMKKYIPYSHFVKQQPNMILVKEDVKGFIQNDMTEHFKNMKCPDEHYFIHILLFIMNRKIIKQQVTFCNYDLHKTQSMLFP